MALEILGNRPDDAEAAYVLAEALHELGRSAEAESLFTHRAAIEPQSAVAALGLGRLALQESDYARAESLLTVARDRFVAADDEVGERVALEQLGWAIARQRRWGEAAESFAEALRLAEAQGDRVAGACLHSDLGGALKDVSRGGGASRIEEATAHLERAIAEARALDLPAVEGRASIPLSIIARWQRNLERSLELRESALRAYERMGDLHRQAACRQRIAAILLARGDLNTAMRQLQRAWTLAEEARDSFLVGMVILNLGHISYTVGDLERSVELWSEALALARGLEVGPTFLLSASLANLGIVLMDLDRHAEALEHFGAVLTSCRQQGERRGEIRARNNMGHCLRMMGDAPAALACLDSALATAQEIGSVGVTQAYLYRDLGLCHLDLGQWDEAEEALAEAGRLGEAMGLHTMGEITRWGLSTAARARGQSERAMQLLDEAIALREGARGKLAGSWRMQSGYFGKAGLLYATAVDLLHEMHQRDPRAGHDRRAFDIAQRAKARAFLDLLEESEVDLRFRADPAYQQREGEILGEIARLLSQSPSGTAADSATAELEITRLENELILLETDLRRADPRYAAVRYPQPCTLDELQRGVLAPGELLFEYLLGDSASFAWVVTTESSRFLKLAPRDEIEAAVRALMPMLRDYNLLGDDATYFVPEARSLAQTLLGPALDDLKEATRVTIVPHGILHYLPFEILLPVTKDGLTARTTFASLPYLVSFCDVGYVPSASILKSLRTASRDAAEPAGTELLLLANPTLPAQDEMGLLVQVAVGSVLEPLAFVGEEARRLRALFPQNRTVVLEGAQATAVNLQRSAEDGSFAFVHFATHGIFNERRPQYSGLVLSPDAAEDDDGFLTMGEVFGLDLECDQVTLSACTSGLGEHVSGEGLVGLTRAFMYAGARNVLATLWEVSGRETAQFMVTFYEEFRRGGSADRVHAVAEAKRCMIAGGDDGLRPGVDLAHPFFWAPFALTGAGR